MSDCSGHGTLAARGYCVCDRNYVGKDCERTWDEYELLYSTYRYFWLTFFACLTVIYLPEGDRLETHHSCIAPIRICCPRASASPP